MRFLVVDDDAISRRIVQLMLKPYGTCVCVESGEAGLEAHRQSIEEKSPFAVIYLDMLMPGLGGLEFLEVLRKTEREQRASAVPVVMLTGDAHVSRISQAQALGVAEYLLKPIAEERLIQGLERLDLLEDLAPVLGQLLPKVTLQLRLQARAQTARYRTAAAATAADAADAAACAEARCALGRARRQRRRREWQPRRRDRHPRDRRGARRGAQRRR